MSAPLMPSPLDYIGRNRFAFYPPIRDAGPNIWILGTGSWSEVQAINAETGRDVWVPRQYVGAVSDSDGDLLVGLTQQLDLNNSEIVPHADRRVIEMPRSNAYSAAGRNGPADVIGIRIEKKAATALHRPAFRVGIFVLLVAGLLALAASAYR